jgi:hypothetical protein
LKSQVERSRSVPVLLLFGYKITRTEWLQLGNILLRSGTISLQKINRTEPLRFQPARTARPPIRAQQLTRLLLQPNKGWSRSVPVHSATKQKTEPLRFSLPNTEQSDSVLRIRDGTALFYLIPQPNTTLICVRLEFANPGNMPGQRTITVDTHTPSSLVHRQHVLRRISEGNFCSQCTSKPIRTYTHTSAHRSTQVPPPPYTHDDTRCRPTRRSVGLYLRTLRFHFCMHANKAVGS